MANLSCLTPTPVLYRFCQTLWKSVAQYLFGNSTGIATGAERIFQQLAEGVFGASQECACTGRQFHQVQLAEGGKDPEGKQTHLSS